MVGAEEGRLMGAGAEGGHHHTDWSQEQCPPSLLGWAEAAGNPLFHLK